MKTTKKIALLSMFISMPIFADGWTAVNYESTIYDYDVSGRVVARYLVIPQVPQPNTQTCGATNVGSVINWLTGIDFTMTSIYDYTNTNGADGIQSDEMLAGLSNVASFVNRNFQQKITVNPDIVGHDTISLAITGLLNQMRSTNRPSIIIGNKFGGSAGWHYLMPFAVVDYNKQKGVYINDSMYGSPSYPGQGVGPNTYLSSDELANYWLPTGSRFFWNRQHNYVTF